MDYYEVVVVQIICMWQGNGECEFGSNGGIYCVVVLFKNLNVDVGCDGFLIGDYVVLSGDWMELIFFGINRGFLGKGCGVDISGDIVVQVDCKNLIG